MEFASEYVYAGAEETENFDEDELDNLDLRKLTEKKKDKKPKAKAPAADSKESKSVFGKLSSFFTKKPAHDPATTESAPPVVHPEPVEEEPKLSESDSEEENENRRKVRKADTNIFSVNLGNLSEEIAVLTGDPLFCSNCKAVYNCKSQTQFKKEEKKEGKEEEGDKLWICEFCDQPNDFNLMEEEIPKENSVDFLLESAKKQEVKEENNIIVFCIDTSGSMCCTTEVHGKYSLKGKRNNDFGNFAHEDNSAEYYHSQNSTWVSRLQCLQGAIETQLENLEKANPNARVVLVTFSNEVTVFDTKETFVVNGDRLNQYENLLGYAEENKVKPDIAIAKCRQKLSDKLWSLEEAGQTALGPALLVSLGIACQSAGSMIILATDGKANIGVGSLDGKQKTEEELAKVESFYSKVSTFAKENGVIVSILSIKGTDCSLEYLAPVASNTGGWNNIVDPLEIGSNLGNILKNPVIATQVRMEVFLHKMLKFRGDSKKNSISKFRTNRDVGNATKETTATFEYSIKKQKVNNKTSENKPSGDNNNNNNSVQESGPLPESVPFQVQIYYTRLDGSKCLRIITDTKKITQDRQKAEEAVRVHVVSLHTAQESSKLAQDGNYTKARMKQITTNRLLHRNVAENPKSSVTQQEELKMWETNALNMDSVLREAKQEERQRGLRYYSAEEDASASDEEEETNEKETEAKGEEKEEKKVKIKPLYKDKRRKERKQNRGDLTSNNIYQAANPMFSGYTYTK